MSYRSMVVHGTTASVFWLCGDFLVVQGVHACQPSVSQQNKISKTLSKTKQKLKMKTYADKVLHAKSSDIAVGDTVLVKKQNAMSTPFDPKPYTVIWRKGNSIVAKQGDTTVRRKCW